MSRPGPGRPHPNRVWSFGPVTPTTGSRPGLDGRPVRHSPTCPPPDPGLGSDGSSRPWSTGGASSTRPDPLGPSSCDSHLCRVRCRVMGRVPSRPVLDVRHNNPGRASPILRSVVSSDPDTPTPTPSLDPTTRSKVVEPVCGRGHGPGSGDRQMPFLGVGTVCTTP